MPSLKQIILGSVVVCALFTTAAAQDSTSPATQRTAVIITAAAAGERVRITAPGSVVQMHVEVYAAGGEKLFDQEIRGGNVFDWHLQNGQGQRVAPGSYVCVVTAKSISRRITQKIGAIRIGEKEASVEPATSAQLSSAQAQAIGPVEENSSWTVSGKDEPQTPTVIAHDGTDGQMIRGRGALTFRIGNFFTGNDREQMRLTEAGDLGIGTSEPRAKLDVAGTIRAQRFLVVKPKPVGTGVSAQDSLTANVTEPDESLLTGSGTQDRIAKWLDGSGTLGDSTITETGGLVGIGTTAPGSKLVVSSNSSVLPPALGIARFADADGVQTAVFADAFGTNPIFNVRRANGTAAAPSAVQANQLLGVIGASAYGASAYTGTRARVAFWASENWTNSVNGTYLTLNTTANGAATPGGTERMRIDSAGNVGIGTNTPVSILDVAGDINTSTQYDIGGTRILSNPGFENIFVGVHAGLNNTADENSFFGYQAGFKSTTGGENSFFGNKSGLQNKTGHENSFFGFQAGDGNISGGFNSFFGINAGHTNVSGDANTAIGNGADVGLEFLHNATAIGANAQVDQNDSLVLGGIKGINDALEDTKVGIGTTAPLATLHVVAPSNLDGNNTADFQAPAIGPNHSHIHYGTKGDWYIRSAAGTESIFGAGKVILQDTGGNVGIGTGSPDQRLTVNGEADKPAGGSWATFSDERLKNIKGRFTSGLKAVMQLQPVRYEYKSDNALGIQSSGEHIGFGAQAVQKIIPEAVSKNDKGYLLINNDPILWTMLNAIKEQQQTIEKLQQENNKLEARNSETDTRLARVETAVKRMAQQNRRRLRRH